MSVLLGEGDYLLPEIDPRMRGDLCVLANCEIPESVRGTFHLVTMAIAQQMAKESKPFGAGLPINCLFIPDREFSVSLDSDQYAACMRFAVYRVSVLSAAANQMVQMTILAEELCHLIWGIADETMVNYKVLEVLRNIFPNLSLRDLGYRE